MSGYEVYEIARNYLILSIILSVISVINFAYLIKNVSDKKTKILVNVFNFTMTYVMVMLNFTVTLLYDSISTNAGVLGKFILVGMFIVGVFAIISLIVSIKSNSKK